MPPYRLTRRAAHEGQCVVVPVGAERSPQVKAGQLAAGPSKLDGGAAIQVCIWPGWRQCDQTSITQTGFQKISNRSWKRQCVC